MKRMTELLERAETMTKLPSRVATWVRVCRLAAVAAVVWSVALQLVAGAFMPDTAVIGAVFGVLAIILTGERRRLVIVTGVLALVAIVVNLPGIVDVLGDPTSGVAFGMALLSTLAAVLCVVAGCRSSPDGVLTSRSSPEGRRR